jgi:hypothetical protein
MNPKWEDMKGVLTGLSLSFWSSVLPVCRLLSRAPLTLLHLLKPIMLGLLLGIPFRQIPPPVHLGPLYMRKKNPGNGLKSEICF